MVRTNKKVYQNPSQVMVTPGKKNSQSSKKKKNNGKISLPQSLPHLPTTDPNASSGGYDNEVKAHSLKVSDHMMSNSVLTDGGKSSVMTILNPCGENGSEDNARFPDGTLSQSGVLRFRQFETIVAPWQTPAETANVTNNWSLYIISPATFKTIAILIAVKDGKALSDTEFRSVFSAVNHALPPPSYPDWEPIGAGNNPNIYYSVYGFKSASFAFDKNSGNSTTIESFRIVGDGMVVMHNTPDLWNQGSFAIGQFETDDTPVETDTTYAPMVFSVAQTSAGNGELTVYYKNPADGTQINLVNAAPLIGPTGLITGVAGSAAQFNLYLPAPDSRPWILHAANVPFNISYTYFPLTQTWQFSAVGVGQAFSIAATSPVGLFQRSLEGNGTLFAGSLFDGFGRPNPSQSMLSLPSLNQDTISQADPKFSAELMKSHCGFYTVRRYFQPVLSMTNANTGGNLKFDIAGMGVQETLEAPGGITNDLFDHNGATIVAVIRGISWACSPTIKSVRFVEFMPQKDSSYSPFVAPTPPKDEDAVEIFRQMQLSGPHSYIPDANFMGTLAAFVMGVVESTPVFLRGARSISKAVISAIDWAEEKIKMIPI